MRAAAALLAAVLLVSPVRAATLTWSFSSDIQTLDPHSSRISFTNNLLGNVYETLVRMDDQLRIGPALATSWDRPSPTVWRFHLRPGVRFHEGQAFTADDVAFSFARISSPAGNRGALAAVAAMRAIDPQTLEVETARPFPILLNALLQFPVVSRTWAEAHGTVAATDLSVGSENYANRHANGTGPFRVASREADAATVLERNPDWWDTPRHNLDRVTFLPIRNASTRTASLLSGSTDATIELPLQDVDRVRANPALQVTQGPELRTVYLGFDHWRDVPPYTEAGGRNPFKDRRVREAIYRAIDIEAIRTRIMRGQAWPAGFMASPYLTGAPSDLNGRLPFDPDAARRLLGQAGYPAGFSTALSCPNDRYVNDEAICQAVAAMLARVGIRVTVQAEATPAWSRRTSAGDVAMFMLGHAALPLADVYSTLIDVVHSRTDKEGGLNYGRYADPRVDALIEASAVEPDEDRRRAVMRDAFALEKADIGHIPLHQQPITWAARRGVELHQAPDNNLRLWLVTVQ